jgi:hypothetical protein
MLRLKYLIKACLLALTLSFGWIVACPSYLLAATLDTYTFAPGVPYNDPTPVGWSASGSFSILDSYLSGDFSVPTTDLYSLSFTLTTPGGSQTFGLSDLVSGGTLNFTGTGTPPATLDGGGGSQFVLANGYEIDIGPNIIPGFLAFLVADSPTTSAVAVWGDWTSTVSDTATPLPAALPLFATGLAALGLLGWRRKRKAQAAA